MKSQNFENFGGLKKVVIEQYIKLKFSLICSKSCWYSEKRPALALIVTPLRKASNEFQIIIEEKEDVDP